MTTCCACGRESRFNIELAHPQTFCFPCATERGLSRLCDARGLAMLRRCARDLPPHWRWLVYLEHAMVWDEKLRPILDAAWETR